MKKILQLLAAFSLLQASGADIVPETISFQGRAMTATGALMGSGSPVNRVAIFRIWGHATNSQEQNLLYSEQQVVTIADGEFSVLVGAGVATEGVPLGYDEGWRGPPEASISAILDGESRFLGVTIDDGTEAPDTEFSPRHQIVSGAFALRSKIAEKLVEGAIITASLPAGIIVTDRILADAITSGQIADGTIDASDIREGAISTAQIADRSITYDKLAQDLPAGMVRIPAGTFTLGNSVAADTDITDAVPLSASVSEFFLGANLVTYGEWSAVNYYANRNGYSLTSLYTGSGESPLHPVHTVSWYDAVKWCNARSQMEGLTPVYYTDAEQTEVYKAGDVELTSDMVKWTANGYRLPTEAEWERAARGGLSNQRFAWGNTVSQNLANYVGSTLFSYDNGPAGSHPLGLNSAGNSGTSLGDTFAPNGYGLYDMAGNLNQWCWDWYGTPYTGGSDPRGTDSGTDRVLRGGSWSGNAGACRVARRSSYGPSLLRGNLGFRVARSSGQ